MKILIRLGKFGDICFPDQFLVFFYPLLMSGDLTIYSWVLENSLIWCQKDLDCILCIVWKPTKRKYCFSFWAFMQSWIGSFLRGGLNKKNLHYIIFNMGEFNKGFSRKKNMYLFCWCGLSLSLVFVCMFVCSFWLSLSCFIIFRDYLGNQS